jgi:PleD family two-component response regulator
VKVADFEAFLRARHEVGRRHILVVDAKRGGLDELLAVVNNLGHQPVVAHNYADALLKALDHFPALFIITLLPNDHEAWKLAEKIRATKALRSFPILFIADSELSEVDTDRALRLAVQGVLTRPFPTETLAQEIERILQRTM